MLKKKQTKKQGLFLVVEFLLHKGNPSSSFPYYTFSMFLLIAQAIENALQV